MRQMSLVITYAVPDDCTPADLQDIVRFHLDTGGNLSDADVYDVSAVKFLAAHTPVID